MTPYLEILREVRTHGRPKPTRAILQSTGRPIDALSVFGRQIRFDLSQGFPAVTTKKLNFDAVVHELLWFLSGSTNVRDLQAKNVHIWDAWADENGELGPVYGKQWRHWEGKEGRTVDQIAELIAAIERVRDDPRDPAARRLIVSAWNPVEAPEMALPPCHTLFQFELDPGGRLSCQLYQRSADLFLGVPFNIASYALLTHLIAHVSGLDVGAFIHTFGDAHIYENHLDQVDEQLRREPLPPPTLWIDPGVRSIEDLRFEHIKLCDYRHHPALRGEVAV